MKKQKESIGEVGGRQKKRHSGGMSTSFQTIAGKAING
jgi:hypothetical protein